MGGAPLDSGGEGGIAAKIYGKGAAPGKGNPDLRNLRFFAQPPAPLGIMENECFGKMGEKIRQKKGVGCPWRLDWVCPGNPLELPLVISMTSLISLDKCRHGLAEWRRRNAEEARLGPVSLELRSVSRWRMEGRARPVVSAHDRIPGGNPVLRNEPNSQEQASY